MEHVRIVGGGFAGVEASWQLLRAGVKVALHEMRPNKMTAAHKTSDLAELVCSNSFKSWTHIRQGVKHEMNLSDSLVLKIAEENSVPAGKTLAVDRAVFSKKITKTTKSTRSLLVWMKKLSICRPRKKWSLRVNIWCFVQGRPLKG